jgi:hypothetical protein
VQSCARCHPYTDELDLGGAGKDSRYITWRQVCAGDHSRLRRNKSMYHAIVIEGTDCSSIATDLN